MDSENDGTGLPERLLRKREVADMFGVAPRTIMVWANDPKSGFPEPLNLNPGRDRSVIAWRQSEIMAWLDSRPRGGKRPHANMFAMRQRARGNDGQRPMIRRPE